MSEQAVIQTFTYSDLDAETRIVVQQRTDEIKTLMRRTAQDIIDIGRKLLEVKEKIGHGNFCDWLKTEFGWSERTAQRYMQVAKSFKSDTVSDLIPAKALYLLARPSTPPEARAVALSRAENGQAITHATAKTIVAEINQSALNAVIHYIGGMNAASQRRVLQSMSEPHNHSGSRHLARLKASNRSNTIATLRRAAKKLFDDGAFTNEPASMAFTSPAPPARAHEAARTESDAQHPAVRSGSSPAPADDTPTDPDSAVTSASPEPVAPTVHTGAAGSSSTPPLPVAQTLDEPFTLSHVRIHNLRGTLQWFNYQAVGRLGESYTCRSLQGGNDLRIADHQIGEGGIYATTEAEAARLALIEAKINVQELEIKIRDLQQRIATQQTGITALETFLAEGE